MRWSKNLGESVVARGNTRRILGGVVVLAVVAGFMGCGSDDPVDPTVSVDIAVNKTVDDNQPTEGDTITYTVIASNNGPDGATGVQLTDVLPQGTLELTYQSSNATQGTYNVGTGLWDVGAIASGGSETLTIVAVVQEGSGGTSITNEASVAAVDQNDSDDTNDSDVAVLNSLNHVLVLAPIKDNTLYQPGAGDLSNGSGEFMFAGRTNAAFLRRAIMAFDLTALPANAVVETVELTLHMSKTARPDPFNCVLHRVQSDWGEGTSNAGGRTAGDGGGGGAQPTTGDATWQHRFFSGSFWNNLGGDYDAFEAATVPVDDVGYYTWSGNGLRDHVIGWQSNPSSNFGWILIGNELTNRTAKRFDTRENVDGTGPRLEITYALP